MTLVRVEVRAEIEGYQPFLLGYSIGTILEVGQPGEEPDSLVAGRVLRACYEEALADAENRLAARAFHGLVPEATVREAAPPADVRAAASP